MEISEEDINRFKMLILENKDRIKQEKDVIEKYGDLFNPSAIDALTKEKFQEFLLLRNNHHWDGIHRQQNAITSDMDRLKVALKILLDESVPIRERLNILFPPDGQNYIKGLGKATATPILLVSYPAKYGVWNAKSEEGLIKLDLINKFKNNQTFADKYLEVNKQLKCLADKYQVSLWQIDEIIGWIMLGNDPITVTDISAPKNKVLQIEEDSTTDPKIKSLKYGANMQELSEPGEISFEEPLEEEVLTIETNPDKRKIFTASSDPEIESLYNKFKRGKLVVQPDFQRHYVWDSKKASRLMESALLGIPLPVIYLAEEEDGREYVIDGQQRLTSFFAYIDGAFPDGKKFKLNGLQVFPELNGKLFSEIDDRYQDKIRYCELRAITFRKESDSELRFEIFERLNTGAVSLNDQELRNCIYRGPYNDLLRELSRDPEFRELLGLKKQEPRMKDVELVLRFASFYHQTYLNYKPPVRAFLNKEMETYRNVNGNDADDLKKAFKNSVLIIKSLVGENAFKRYYPGNINDPDGGWEQKQFNASLYDVLMYSFAREDINTVYQNLDAIREGYIELFNDPEFVDAILIATSNKEKVVRRFDKMRNMLQVVLGIGKKEDRCFTFEFKQKLYNNDSTCAICGNQILNIDDAAVDHIKQYWTGGATIPENARLAHRFCNWSRPRKD